MPHNHFIITQMLALILLLYIKFVTALATWVFIASADFSYMYIKCEIVCDDCEPDDYSYM